MSPRDPQADTTAVHGQYLQLVTIHGRDFQQYSIDKSIHFVPVDDVGRNPASTLTNAQSHLFLGRSRQTRGSKPGARHGVRQQTYLSPYRLCHKRLGLWLWRRFLGHRSGRE